MGQVQKSNITKDLASKTWKYWLHQTSLEDFKPEDNTMRFAFENILSDDSLEDAMDESKNTT